MVSGINILTQDGYVVYSHNWPGTNHQNQSWNIIRSLKEYQVHNLLTQLPQPNNNYYYQIGQKLIDLGNEERKKEVALIEQALGEKVDISTEFKVVHEFNKIISGKENYEQALKQIKLATENYDDKHMKQMAPVLSSLFLSKFQHRLGEAINNFIKKYKEDLLMGDITQWEEQYEYILDKAIDDSFKDLFTYQNKEAKADIFGSEIQHLELLNEYLRQIGDSNDNIFTRMIRKKINVNNMKLLIQNRLVDIRKKISAGKNMTGWTWAKDVVGHSKSRAGQLGGTVNELIQQLVQSMGLTFNGNNRVGEILEGEKLKTDNILIFSEETTIDIQKAIEGLQQELQQNSKNLIESANTMSNYYESHLKNLKNSFIIYTSGKAYSLDTLGKSGGFTNDKDRALDQLPIILQQGPNALDRDKVEKFMTVVANTRGGAVLESSRGRVNEYLEETLFQSMAYLLFDDWVAIGGEAGDNNAIHAFTLDNVQIPLSVLLKAAGQAMITTSNYKDWFSSKINYPKNLKYSSWREYPDKENLNSRGKVVKDVEGAWEEQRKEALDGFTFSTHFMKNFKDYIKELTKDYM